MTPGRVRADLLALSGRPSGVYAVGAGGTALRHDGRGWQADAAGFDGGLRAVCASGRGEFAAGDGGTILRRKTRE